MLPPSNGSLLRFGVFDLDLQTGVLRKNGHPLKLQPQPAKVLTLLVARPNELITREELREQIWGNSSYGDSEHALNVCISQLRMVLDDNAETPRWIETVPRRGYRFLAPVEGVARPEVPGNGAEVSTKPSQSPLQPPGLPSERSQAAQTGKKLLFWCGAAFIFTGFVFGAGFLLGKKRVAPVSSPSFTRLTYQRGILYSARFAPDGHVVFGASWENKPVQLFSTRADSPEALPLELKDAHLLAVSREGEMAVTLRGRATAYPLFLNGTLARVPITGGAPREIVDDVRYADWDASSQLAIVHHEAGKSRLEYPIRRVLYETGGWISHIRISPSGDKVAFLDHPMWAEDRGSVAVTDLAGNRKTLSSGWTTVEGLAWSPKGDEIWFTASHSNLRRELLAVDLSGRQRTVLQVPGELTLQDIAPDGRVLISFDKERNEVAAFRPSDGSQRDLSWFDSTLVTGVSADGRKVLLDEQGGQTGSAYFVGIKNTDGSPPVRLGEGSGGGFSPDEQWTATETFEPPESIMVLPVGAGQPVEIKHKGILNVSWSVCFMPDGKRLVYTGIEPGHAIRTYIQGIDGSVPRAVTPEGANARLPSPDGKYLAGLDAKNNLTVYMVEGGQPHVVPGDTKGFVPTRWSPDGTRLYVHRRSQVPSKVYRVDWRNGSQEFVTQLSPQDLSGVLEVWNLAMTPDAKLFVYDYDRILSELYVVDGLH